MDSSLPFFGKTLIVAGVLLVLLGALSLLAGRFPQLGIGRLPGDIFIQRGNFTFYFPLATCILISLVLTGLFWLVSYLMRR
jgi:hypothetical protein